MSGQRSDEERAALHDAKAMREAKLAERDRKILRGHRLGLTVAQITKAAGCNWAVAREVLERSGLTPKLEQPNRSHRGGAR